jgi:hypothetical protein
MLELSFFWLIGLILDFKCVQNFKAKWPRHNYEVFSFNWLGIVFIESDLRFCDLRVLVSHWVGETESERNFSNFVVAAIVFQLPWWLNNV